MRTREQERMRQSLEQVQAAQRSNHADGYGRACLQFPVLVRTAGLCQTIALYKGKNDASAQFVRDLEAQLRSSGLFPGQAPLLDQLATVELTDYMLLTREALAVADWLKRFAQSELDADPTHDGD